MHPALLGLMTHMHPALLGLMTHMHPALLGLMTHIQHALIRKQNIDVRGDLSLPSAFPVINTAHAVSVWHIPQSAVVSEVPTCLILQLLGLLCDFIPSSYQ